MSLHKLYQCQCFKFCILQNDNKKKTDRADTSERDISKAIHEVWKTVCIREAAILYNIAKAALHIIQKAKNLEPENVSVSDTGNQNVIADTCSVFKFGSKYKSQIFTR